VETLVAALNRAARGDTQPLVITADADAARAFVRAMDAAGRTGFAQLRTAARYARTTETAVFRARNPP
jgi:hypothetical protein